MTKKEAIALEALCEKYLAKVLNEKVEMSMTLSGKLKVTFGENFVTFTDSFSEVIYMSFDGFALDLKEAIDKIVKCMNENREDFELLRWSYENRNLLTGDEEK
jgi:hypothetical protein